jgi:hypothetical protein
LPLRTSSEPRQGVEVVFAERERLLDAQAAAPEHRDQGAQPVAVAVVAGLAHHGDDLFDGRRVRGIELPLVAGRTSGVVAGHGRGRATPTSGIAHCWDGHGISSQSHSGRSPLLYQRGCVEMPQALRPGDAEAGASPAKCPQLVHCGSRGVNQVSAPGGRWRTP